ncbi:hypothetical protein KSD_52550 [Ktedonobacter sp. SOSP1-85]|uniref:YihY/virulence factor BrkB family protein n=1 Tax=Ktedonobacter sp. SOSP1-85 TaxID=2778367 RepID=UPI001916486E|nr:YihY/virulence factor BrkB family protein [Ktedonobacter sp. SOSP1-85]GHO77484.1 hypothetical protein KSD_52550 [Ktedonobacter sp. SOSP1-85]
MASGISNMESEAHKKKSATQHLLHGAEAGGKTFREFLNKFNNDWSSGLAGLLAYNILMSIVPIAIALIAILGFALGGVTDTQQLINQATSFFPIAGSNKAALSLAITQLQKNAGWLTIIAVVLALFNGSNLFVTIENCLDIVYRVRPRPMIRQRLVAIGMVLIFVFLVPIMVFASSLPTLILGLLQNNPALKSIPFVSTIAANPVLSYLAGFGGSVLVGFMLFEAIYVIVPNQQISWKNSWKGALGSSIALALFLALFPIYARFGLGNYTGQVGFAIIFLIFFYYFATILMIGGEINAFFSEGVRPLPNNLITFVSTMAGKLNKDIPEKEAEAIVNIKATELADRQHVAEARKQEEQNRHRNQEKFRQTPGYLQHGSAGNVPAAKPSKKGMVLQVAAGSLVAVLLEWFRLRQRH